MRTSPAARLLMLAFRFDLAMLSPFPVAEVPASHQLLRSSFSAGSRQFAEIFGTIHIPRNPWQFEHNPRQARCLRRGQVRQEAVVPEPKRKQITQIGRA